VCSGLQRDSYRRHLLEAFLQSVACRPETTFFDDLALVIEDAEVTKTISEVNADRARLGFNNFSSFSGAQRSSFSSW
jgi:hypothetical protein